jgi:ASC-1-like (ASCH) protein
MENEIIMELDDEWFDEIYKGTKVVEIRKNSKTWEKIVQGTILRITPKPFADQKRKPFLVKVVHINIYKGIDPLYYALIGEGINNVLPGREGITETIEVYLRIPGWTAKLIRETGIKAIGIKRI